MEDQQLLREYFHLLPTKATEVGARIKELANLSYRVTHNISTLEISSYEKDMSQGEMPSIDLTRNISFGLEALALRDEIIRVYTSDGADGTKMGFEYVADMVKEGDELTLVYVLIDDGRKYKVNFTSNTKVNSPGEQ